MNFALITVLDALFGGGGGGHKVVMPTATAQQARRTAEPVTQVSEDEKNRLKLAAAFINQDWDNLTLGKKALLGLTGA